MNSHCSYIRFFFILTWNPLQWILANTTSVPAEDSYHWLDISTTVCDISKDITTYNVLHLFLRLETWPAAYSDTTDFPCLQFLDRYRGKRVPV